MTEKANKVLLLLNYLNLAHILLGLVKVFFAFYIRYIFANRKFGLNNSEMF